MAACSGERHPVVHSRNTAFSLIALALAFFLPGCAAKVDPVVAVRDE
jgi:hypothetical protein